MSHSIRKRPGRQLYWQVLLVGAAMLLPALTRADTWDGRFHTRGIDGIAQADATYGSDLIVGGNITAAGEVVVANVARWDGAQWHAPGDGLNGTVRRLLVMDGDLYACGDFTQSGPVTVNHVARWDGVQWHAVGAGLPIAPLAMAVYDGALWCAGWRYDGAAWSEVVATNGYVRDLIVSDDQLVFGGSFTTAGGMAASYAAAWDGTQVTAMVGQPRAILDLEVVAGQLYALGLDVYGEGAPVTAWDGAAWPVVGDLPDDYMSHYLRLMNQGGQLRMMASVSPGIPPIWWTDIATWDGQSWTWLDETYFMADSRHCFVYDGDLVLSGPFSLLGSTIAHGIGRLTAAGPVALGTGGDGFGGTASWLSDLCATPDGVVVSGSFDSVGPVVTGAAALWDGAFWQPRADPYATIERLVYHAGELHAFFWSGDVVTNNHMVWTGTAWDYRETWVSGGLPNDALSYGGHLLTAKWDIADWSSSPAPAIFASVDGAVYSLLDWSGDLVAGGDFVQVEDAPSANLAILHDGAWSELAGGVVGIVKDAIVHDGHLVIGGILTAAGGVTVAEVATLVDGEWQPLGDQLDGEVDVLASYGGLVYAGGDFSVAGDAGRNFARWNGHVWHIVGGGANRPVTDMVVFDDKLHLAGEFSVVGHVPAARFAIWDGSTILPVPTLPSADVRLRDAAPNPFNPVTTIGFALARSGQVRLDAYDVCGRHVRTLVDGRVDAGDHAATWDGRADDGRVLPSGMYLLRLQAGNEVRTSKVALLE